MSEGECLYKVLGLNKNATQDEIKKAFRTNAIKLHPDKNKDDPNAQQKFQKINEAYTVLSDEAQKAHYDRVGHMEGYGNGPGGGGGPVDINEILKNVFGGGMGMGGMPGGFSFSFEAPQDHNIFNMFGGGGHPQRIPIDVIEINVDINDLFYGNTKHVEFEVMDLCDACNGSGAQDPSHIIKCITCKGQGRIVQQMGPFIQETMCPSCSGNGTTIKNNKTCNKCKGAKTCFNKKIFDLKLPQGIPHNFEVKMEKKGSYDERMKRQKDIIFKFKYNIEAPYSLDDHGNVIYQLNINIEELLGGFTKTIRLYRDEVTIKSDKYFNPNKPIVLKDRGIFFNKKKKTSDLIFKVNVEFIDSEKLATKYSEVTKSTGPSKKDGVIDLNEYISK